jgi:thiol-disulfide isomerase/thioredoxin
MLRTCLRLLLTASAVSLPAVALSAPMASASISTAPELTGITHWINSPPLTMQSLRGKVVLVDFWTFECINCLHALPHVKDLYARYKDKGLVVVGVHTPELDAERNAANLTQAVQRLDIDFPVAQDNDEATWNAWRNQYWPAQYLVDRQGGIVYRHIGEGQYGQMEDAVRSALGLPPLPAS